jgi:transposase-like protein
MDSSQFMERERTPLLVMAYGVYLYCSRRLRLASRCLDPIIHRSHISIWNWVQRFAPLAKKFRTDRRRVREIIIDETLFRFRGMEYRLWIAYEPHIDGRLMLHLSVERAIMVCYLILKGSSEEVRSQTSRDRRRSVVFRGPQVAATGASGVSHRGEESHREVHPASEGLSISTARSLQEGDRYKRHVWNWLNLFILHIHLDMDLHKIIPFLVMKGS